MIRKLLLGLFLGVIAVSCALPVFADPLDTWTKRVDGTDQELHATAYGNNTFVVVGDNGTILSSPDGVAWTARAVGLTTEQFRDVIYQDCLFVAVGTGGAICTSPNGINWISRTSGTSNTLNGVAYGNNVFVAVGEEEVDMREGIQIPYIVTTSPNGIEWTAQAATSPAYELEGIAFGNGIFVAVGYDDNSITDDSITIGDNGRILTSTNGTSWTEHNPGTDSPLNGVGFGNGLFVVVADSGTIFTSPYGITWASLYSDSENRRLRKVAFGDNTFVVVGGDSGGLDPYAVMLTSPDGEAWTNKINAATNGDTQLYGVGFGDNTFMAIGGYNSGIIFQSNPLPHSGDSGSLPVGPLAVGISAFLVWWKRRKQRQE